MRGPRGERRPAGAFDNAVRVGRILSGVDREEFVDEARSRAGRRGAKARAAKGVRPGEPMVADGEEKYR